MARTRPLSALLATLALAGCKDEGNPSPPPHASSAPLATVSAPLDVPAETGIADCDAYFRAAEACFDRGDHELQGQLRESLARYRNQLEHAETEVAKQAVGVGCAAALESLREEPGCN
ncbi:MAG TPA: hypothetical protein ENK57_07075 [Polyangiaceae bacterium]|nr:hypothetical protein [Polyangiaceae bacterium]